MTDSDADLGVLAQDLIYAGLDAMRSSADLDLCAYLHVAPEQGPQLFLEAPALAGVDPTEAFNLFAALRDALEREGSDEEAIGIGRYEAVAVRTRGPASRGLHVAGRTGRGLEEAQRDTVARLARRFGDLTHALETIAGPAVPSGAVPSALRVSVQTGEGRARAEVEVSGAARPGLGEAATPVRAVASAAIDAVDAALKLVDAVEGEIGGERAVLVVLSDPLGRAAIGASLLGEGADALAAAAGAALDATVRLATP